MKNKATVGKVISIAKAARISAAMKKHGKKLVTINGSFDLLHSGHITLLQKARSSGDALLVLLNSDDSVRRYKGSGRPIVPEKERAQMLTGIAGVDYVAIFDDINPVKVLGKIKPAIHCNGSDWGKNCIERAVVEENGGVIKVIPLIEGFSTSTLIKSIQKAEATRTPRAILIDRDGVINDHMRGGIKGGYVGYKEHFIFLPGVFEALRKLSKTDFKLIIITNQSGIARGYYSHSDVKRLHDWLLSEFRKKGIRIDAVYFCPHHPDEKCNCRKPGIAMFEMAAKDFGLSLAKSWMIGDSSTDIIAGRSANTKTVKIGKPMDKKLKLEPDHYAKDLKQAVSIILKSEKL